MYTYLYIYIYIFPHVYICLVSLKFTCRVEGRRELSPPLSVTWCTASDPTAKPSTLNPKPYTLNPKQNQAESGAESGRILYLQGAALRSTDHLRKTATKEALAVPLKNVVLREPAVHVVLLVLVVLVALSRFWWQRRGRQEFL